MCEVIPLSETGYEVMWFTFYGNDFPGLIDFYYYLLMNILGVDFSKDSMEFRK